MRNFAFIAFLSFIFGAFLLPFIGNCYSFEVWYDKNNLLGLIVIKFPFDLASCIVIFGLLGILLSLPIYGCKWVF